jgi:hypothetical protein
MDVQIVFNPDFQINASNLEHQNVSVRRDAVFRYFKMLKIQIPELEFLDYIKEIPEQVRPDCLYMYFQENAEVNQERLSLLAPEFKQRTILINWLSGSYDSRFTQESFGFAGFIHCEAFDAWERKIRNNFGHKITFVYGLNGFSKFSEPPHFKSLFTFGSSTAKDERPYTFFFMGHLSLDRILCFYLHKLAQSFGLIEKDFDYSVLAPRSGYYDLPKVEGYEFDDLDRIIVDSFRPRKNHYDALVFTKFYESIIERFFGSIPNFKPPRLLEVVSELGKRAKTLQIHIDSLSEEEKDEYSKWQSIYKSGRVDINSPPSDSLILKYYPVFDLSRLFFDKLKIFEFDELHKQSQKKCACNLLVELRLPPDDHQATFVKTGEENEGYFFGTGYECSECGGRWFDAIGDDDFGRSFWEYWDKDRNGYYEYSPRETQPLELLERILKKLSE